MVGCLHYEVGLETRQERDNHVRSHDRPFKCPKHGCFYEEVGFTNSQGLNRHLSACHTDPTSSKFLFPRLRNSRPPTEAEQERFWEAIERQDIDLVRNLIRRHSSLKDRVGLDGYTALQHAARHGKLGTALLLLHCGSNIGAVNKHGTALNVACSYGQTNMVQLLLSSAKREEDVNSKDGKGDTPLLSSLRSRHVSAQLAVVRLLLEDSRVFADSKDLDSRTPLSLAAASRSLEMVPVLKMLLNHDRTDVNTRDNEGRTPLSWAASRGTGEGVKALLEHGVAVDVNAKDHGGMTPLLWATSRGSAGIVSVFLEHGVGVDVNGKDDGGRTPLMWAASGGSAGIGSALLEHSLGVEVNATDSGGRASLLWAGSWDAASIVRMLLEHGMGVDVNTKDKRGMTPLSWAALTGNAEVVSILLRRGVGVDVNSKDNEGRTPLSWAAELGTIGVVLMLLESGMGVDVNAKDNGSRTPLSWAEARNDWDKELVLNALVKHGGDR